MTKSHQYNAYGSRAQAEISGSCRVLPSKREPLLLCRRQAAGPPSKQLANWVRKARIDRWLISAPRTRACSTARKRSELNRLARRTVSSWREKIFQAGGRHCAPSEASAAERFCLIHAWRPASPSFLLCRAAGAGPQWLTYAWRQRQERNPRVPRARRGCSDHR